MLLASVILIYEKTGAYAALQLSWNILHMTLYYMNDILLQPARLEGQGIESLERGLAVVLRYF